MPQALRRFVIITSHTVKPNRKLNIFEKLWYKYLQFSCFDSIEKLNTVLDLPKVSKNSKIKITVLQLIYRHKLLMHDCRRRNSSRRQIHWRYLYQSFSKMFNLRFGLTVWLVMMTSSCSITVLLLARQYHSRTEFSKPEWAGLVCCAFVACTCECQHELHVVLIFRNNIMSYMLKSIYQQQQTKLMVETKR